MKTISHFCRNLNQALILGLFSFVLLALFPTYVASEESASPHSFSGNVTLASEYVYRGLTQTNEDPALQGGFDYSHESGFYLGVWASNLEFGSMATDQPSLEINVYGGVASEFANGIGWDLGALYYIYPDQNEDVDGDYDFLELYASLSYEWGTEYKPAATIGFAYSPDFYGEDDTGLWVHGGLGLTVADGFNVYANAGYQDVDGDKTTPEGFDYFTYTVGVSKTIDILTFDLAWHDATDACDGDNDPCEALVFSLSSSW